MKRGLLAALAATVAFAAASCGTAPATQAPQTDPVSDFIREVRRGAPENALLGIGASNHSNRSLARSSAEARARAEIARQVEVVVENMITVYVAGSEADQNAVLSFQEDITRTLTQQTQRGAIIRDEVFINGEQVMIVMLTSDALRDGIMTGSQAAAALAPHMGSAQWALERMDQALATQNGLEPTVRRQD
jgi:hypothetical protein